MDGLACWPPRLSVVRCVKAFTFTVGCDMGSFMSYSVLESCVVVLVAALLNDEGVVYAMYST